MGRIEISSRIDGCGPAETAASGGGSSAAAIVLANGLIGAAGIGRGGDFFAVCGRGGCARGDWPMTMVPPLRGLGFAAGACGRSSIAATAAEAASARLTARGLGRVTSGELTTVIGGSGGVTASSRGAGGRTPASASMRVAFPSSRFIEARRA
jgi:hypothetical protein